MPAPARLIIGMLAPAGENTIKAKKPFAIEWLFTLQELLSYDNVVVAMLQHSTTTPW